MRLLTCFFASLVLFSSCRFSKPDALTIATAANAQYAIDELVQVFNEETGIECQTIISSSGKLSAQIRQGAPYDVFVSADMKYPSALYNEGLALNEPEVYAYGKIVLFTYRDDIEPSIELLEDPEITHIAIANPKTAPYGVAAEEVLKHYDLYDKVKDKLVYGESIAQTTQFIISKSASLGFIAMSVVLSPELKDKGSWISIDENAYNPIKQGITIIDRESKNLDKAEKFYNFLYSEKAQSILKKYGYTTNIVK